MHRFFLNCLNVVNVKLCVISVPSEHSLVPHLDHEAQIKIEEECGFQALNVCVHVRVRMCVHGFSSSSSLSL